MPKPSEIFDTPEATGFSRVGGNEEVRTITCRTCGGDGYTVEPSMPDGEPEQVQCNDCHAEGEYTTLDEVRRVLTTKDQEKEEVISKRNAIVKEYKEENMMFILKVEDGKTYEASMPIPKWGEVGKLELREALPTEDNK